MVERLIKTTQNGKGVINTAFIEREGVRKIV
jgi:hypothetical protein